MSVDAGLVVQTLKDVKFLDWAFEVRAETPQTTLFRVVFEAPDAYNPEHMQTQWGRWWAVAEDDTPEGLVKTAFAAIKMAVEHETRELFFYKGKRVLSPHKRL